MSVVRQTGFVDCRTGALVVCLEKGALTMPKCCTGLHAWLDAEDARRCCNPAFRRIVGSLQDMIDLGVERVQLAAVVACGGDELLYGGWQAVPVKPLQLHQPDQGTT